MMQICTALGDPFFREGRVETVVGAATGGIPLAVMTAITLGNGQRWPYPAVAWADKVGGDFTFERAGFADQLNGKGVLVVEDLLNTGDTTKKVIAQVRQHGGDVVGVSVVCNRGSETAESLGVPRLEALCEVDFQAFDVGDCPLCAGGQPIVEDIGHGGAYKAVNPDYVRGYVKLLSA